MRNKIIKEIICRDRNQEQYIHYSSHKPTSPEVLIDAARRTLASVAPSFGSCVMLSAAYVAALEVHYSIPAVAVLGDLRLQGITVFECKNNIPMPSRDDEFFQEQWDGHCWVEVGDIICDLSIFRTAYAINRSSVLKRYIESNFGKGKGALLSPFQHLPHGMEFSPKYVLNDTQISGILAGLEVQQTSGEL